MYLYQKNKKTPYKRFMDVNKFYLSYFNFAVEKTLDKIKSLKNAIYTLYYFAYLSILLKNLYKYTIEGIFIAISDHGNKYFTKFTIFFTLIRFGILIDSK